MIYSIDDIENGCNCTKSLDYSGADVQVSKRGIYAPGTTNRIVSVKGSQVKSSLASG